MHDPKKLITSNSSYEAMMKTTPTSGLPDISTLSVDVLSNDALSEDLSVLARKLSPTSQDLVLQKRVPRSMSEIYKLSNLNRRRNKVKKKLKEDCIKQRGSSPHEDDDEDGGGSTTEGGAAFSNQIWDPAMLDEVDGQGEQHSSVTAFMQSIGWIEYANDHHPAYVERSTTKQGDGREKASQGGESGSGASDGSLKGVQSPEKKGEGKDHSPSRGASGKYNKSPSGGSKGGKHQRHGGTKKSPQSGGRRSQNYGKDLLTPHGSATNSEARRGGSDVTSNTSGNNQTASSTVWGGSGGHLFGNKSYEKKRHSGGRQGGTQSRRGGKGSWGQQKSREPSPSHERN